jgi:ABC-2 type transport system permease protein
MSTTALRALVRKDLQVFFSDRRAVLMSFAVPIAIASFFGFLFGGQSGKSKGSRIPIQIVDQDNGTISREVTSNLAADKTLEVKSTSADAAREAVRKGKAVVAVILPSGFGVAAGKAFFSAAKKPELELLYDPSHAAELGMVRGILTQHVMQAVSKETFNGKQGRAAMKEALENLDQNQKMAEEDKKILRDMFRGIDKWYERADREQDKGNESAMGSFTMPYDVHEEAITSGKEVAYNGFAHSFAGMGVQFMLFMALDMGISVLTQRQRGLWKRLRAAPLSRHLLLMSRALSGTIIALMILLAGFAFGRVVFGVRIEGSLVGFLAVCVACALMASGFGLLVAALGKTPEATRGLAIFVTLIMVMLGGAWVPSFIFPPWLQKFTLVIPTRWAVDGLDAMTWRGLGVGAAIGPVGVLLTFAILFGVLATARFRWDAD